MLKSVQKSSLPARRQQFRVSGQNWTVPLKADMKKLTETAVRPRSAEIMSRPQMFINLLIVFSCFRDVGLVARFGYSPHKAFCAFWS
jgi:hypothetical protein